MKPPSLVKVQSSNIEAMGHSDNRLWVRFAGGGLYSYADVPRALYEEGLKAESIGRWFHSTVKGRFIHAQHDR